MRRLLIACVLSTSSGSSGCGGSEPSASPKVVEEPCGYAVGQRLCELPLTGRVRNATTGLATAEPEGPFTFRDVYAKGTQRYVFVHTSAYW